MKISVSEMMTGRPGETSVPPVGIVTKGRVPTCQQPIPCSHDLLQSTLRIPLVLLSSHCRKRTCLAALWPSWEHAYLACIKSWGLFLAPHTSGMVVHAHNPRKRVMRLRSSLANKQFQKGGELIMHVV